MRGISFAPCKSLFRVAALVAPLAFVLVPHEVQAQSKASGYAVAADAFTRLTLDERVKLQVLLTAAGYWPAVPNADFSTRLFDAISRFQADTGFLPLGFLNDDQFAKLRNSGGPLLDNWGFQVIRHPVTGTPLWVPAGLQLLQEQTPSGIKFTNQAVGFVLTYDYFPEFDVRRSFEVLKSGLLRKGSKIEYEKLYKDQFYVFSISDGATDGYVRYHQLGRSGIGFTLYWDHTATDAHVERIATLISASLWSAISGAPFTTPFSVNVQQVAAAPSAISIPKEYRPQAESQGPTIGTGFFVTDRGHILTNAHVVAKCSDIRVSASPGTFIPATLVARDTTNDLALLKVTTSPTRIAALRPAIRLGENIEAFGYPLSGLLSTTGNFTLGNVTSLSGLADDSRYLQISVPVQPGNSGGPLLDQNGNLVGVVSGKLNALNIMLATKGDIPQNVNFAIKSSIAISFLTSNSVKFQTGEATQTVPPADLADQAKAMSVYIECR